MGSYPNELPFDTMEVVNLLDLHIRRQQADSIYVDCLFCDDHQGRMNVNFVKNVWRYSHCNARDGMLTLYAGLNYITASGVYWGIIEALYGNIQEEYTRSGDEA